MLFLRSLLLAGILGIGITARAAADRDTAPEPHSLFAPAPARNAVLITFDDLRADTPGFNGGPARTPNFDRLAAASTNFKNAITTTGLCSPSRAALFTGRYGHETGLDDNCHTWHSRTVHLSYDEPTLLEWARLRGYLVGYFGKWHLGPDGPIRRGAHRFSAKGFERGAALNYRKPTGYDRIRRYYEPGRAFTAKPEYYDTRPGAYEGTSEHLDSQEAIAFLKEARELKLPFLLSLNFHAPHPPYVVPKPFDTMYDPAALQLPANFLHRGGKQPRYQNDPLWFWHDVGHLTELDWRKMTTHYWGFVSLADAALGRVLAVLEEEKLLENTLVVVAGDQGSMLGEHALYDKGPYSFEELIRVPLLIHVPGAKPGAITRQVSLMDVNQTICEWLDLRPGSGARHTRSLLPLTRQEPGAWSGIADEAFYRYEWYNGKWFGIRAIRTPEWKYCWNPVDVDELYDLKNDRHEMENRIDDPARKPELKQLRERLLQHLQETGDPAAGRLRESHGL